jgi:hypothetical protein
MREADDVDVARAAWSRLGALNAARVDHVPMDVAVRYLEVASRQPLTNAYPIFALLIENACRRFSRTDSARSNISPLFEAAILGTELSLHASARARVAQKAGLDEVKDRVAGQTVIIDVGEREAALTAIREWLAANKPSYLKISDPYFTPADIDMIRLVREVQPSCRVMILTSRAVHKERQVAQPWDEAYVEAWRNHCDDEPPEVFIAIVGNRQGDGPIHDRWWISQGVGLEMGTSWNALGAGKVSTLRSMDPDEAFEKERLLDEFLVERKVERDGVKYNYVTASL